MGDSRAYMAKEARALMRSLPKNSRLSFTDDDTTASNGGGKGPSKEVTSGDQKPNNIAQEKPNGPATNGEGDGPTVPPEPKKKSPEEMSQNPAALLEEGEGKDGEADAKSKVGVIDDAKWAAAQERVKTEYGYDEANPKYWKAVQLIYEKMAEGTAET